MLYERLGSIPGCIGPAVAECLLMRLKGVRLGSFLIVVFLAMSACGVAGAQIIVAAPSASPSPASGVPTVNAAPAPYAMFTKGMNREEGLFAVLTRDRDVYLEINASQFDRTYILSTTIATGIGGYGLAPGQYAGEHVISFRRIGNRLLFIERNPHFSARPNTPEATSLSASVGDSIWMALPIMTEDPKRNVVVVPAAPFLNDLDGIGQFLSLPRLTSGGLLLSSYHVDPSRSYFEWAKAFPKNVNLQGALTFAGRGAAGSSAADPQSLFLRIHYSFAEIPGAGSYVPRLADDRVGYFETAHEDVSADAGADPMVRYIDRWNLRNGPIRFYLTNEIPQQYRSAVRDALLRWNGAFAKIGHPHAIEVSDQPKDPQWDAEDIRYSTVRWATNYDPAFSAEGQTLVNPLTGEILRATIIVDGEAIRAMQRGSLETLSLTAVSDPSLETSLGENLAYAFTALELQGGLTQAGRAKYGKDLVYSIVLHEAGHAFGLRHNFAASTYFTPSQLRSAAFTRQHGISASVMDYLPLNLWSAKDARGELFQRRLGPYDDWAIRYGYQALPATTPGEERPYLRAIAGESTRPEYAYATDEDATAYGGYDPRAQQMDLSSDPLAFDDVQMQLVRRSIGLLDTRYPRDDRSFAEEREAFDALFAQYRRSALLATRYIGGYYTSRAHRGQRGGAPPFRPVPIADERRAFQILARNVFATQALTVSPRLLNDLGPVRYDDWGDPRMAPPDQDAITDRIYDLQSAVLNAMFSPTVMDRLLERRAHAADPAQVMSLQQLFDWTTASVWTIQGSDAFHRTLQRTYTDLLTQMITLNGPPKRNFLIFTIHLPPIEAQELARQQLTLIAARIKTRLSGGGLDSATRAHLQDMYERINASLRAQEIRD